MFLGRKGSFLTIALVLISASLCTAARGASQTPDPLKPGDIVRLSLSREKEMSGDYPVDETGAVALPLIGIVQTSGVSSDALKAQIVAKFNEQLRNQTIQIIFLRRVNVMGAVQKPGLYHVDPTMSLADAVALAGGPTKDGKLEDIRVLRGNTEIEADINEPALQRVTSGDHILVPERGWVSRYMPVIIGAGVSTGVWIVRAIILN